MIKSDFSKGVAPLVGVLLLISIFFLFMAQYQNVQIPEEKNSIEGEHETLTNQQMSEIASQIVSSGDTRETTSINLDFGVEYNFNIIFSSIFEALHVDPVGTMQGEPFSNQIEIHNAQGVGEAQKYWTGEDEPCEGVRNHCFTTSSIRYVADYQEFEDNTIKYLEHQNLYRISQDPFEENRSYLKDTGTQIIEEEQINLITLASSFSTTRTANEDVIIEPKSSSTNTISVRGSLDDDDERENIELKIPTNLPEEIWLEDLVNLDNENIEDFSYNEDGVEDIVEIELNGNETYELSLSQLHISTELNVRDVDDPGPAYIAWTDIEDVNIREGSTQTLSAQVRDRFNNPVEGVRVEARAFDQQNECFGDFSSASDICNGYQQPGNQISTSTGQVSFTYEAPQTEEDRDISIELRSQDIP